MRLQQRGRVTIQCNGREMRAAVRPLSGVLTQHRYGQYVQDMLRLLLPCDAVIAAGDALTVSGAPYICVHTRPFPGHIQADLRRCSR
ncbi:MAG: hypothetical protein IJ662_05865 [Clostridia bacterium]|nr:hypothetical protein [Clostridia bacterium]